MKRKFAIGLVIATLAVPASAGEKPATKTDNPYEDLSRAMTISMAKAMEQMMRAWGEASRTMVEAASKPFEGTELQASCVNCHAHSDQIYENIADRFADYIAGLEGHKKLKKPETPKSE